MKIVSYTSITCMILVYDTPRYNQPKCKCQCHYSTDVPKFQESASTKQAEKLHMLLGSWAPNENSSLQRGSDVARAHWTPGYPPLSCCCKSICLPKEPISFFSKRTKNSETKRRAEKIKKQKWQFLVYLLPSLPQGEPRCASPSIFSIVNLASF